ncbi:PstS family phosphate ABC transporter substrate-binding protein [Botrimarina mediterranea]|uniref:Phosphate-binding protein n=1 Tax=Botrimarina mediterranea TaxID=2528022 RepID=A0A518KDB1_9BACT|nr:PstS family phosphate ABC transporter substrate-binding protein [Botrimarina mediterranea]QDV75767.1 Phosphate-binding protein PstS precursor [Botrimarina mediterranea]
MKSGVRFCAAVLVSLPILAGCGRQESIKIDGSSTVYPISEAVAEEFREERPGVRVTVGLSGTGGGFKKFTAGEIDICDASRGIKPEEVEALAAAKVPYTELSVAFDGIAIVVNPENDWCDTLTVEQLASIWRPLDDSPVMKWNELNPEWPDEEIKLYGPGTDSGTFEYFTEVIVGEAKSCRSDFAASEDDNVLVTGVAEDKYSLGYFGFAYYAENEDKLKLIGVAQGEAEPVRPSLETIRSNEYAPLSRPLYLYVRNDLLTKPEGLEFVEFYLDQAGKMAEEVGYVPVSDEVAAENQKRFEAAKPAK